MILVLLDTNTYLRLAKRIRPILGVEFGHKQYKAVVDKAVEDEVYRSDKLRFHYPWFDQAEHATERVSTRIRLSKEESAELEAATSFLHDHVLENAKKFTSFGRQPPSPVDCKMLAFGQVREAIVVTDDIGMHLLAEEFEFEIWHGYELIEKLRAAKKIDHAVVRDIYDALEANGDITHTWREAKHTTFKKVFGNPKD